MDNIKELTDFYMWMQENDHDHNIRARVERKAEMYLNGINVGQKLPIHSVVWRSEQLVLFADWLQYNGKWDLPKKQAENFLKEQQEQN